MLEPSPSELGVADDSNLFSVSSALALLTRQPVLLAVTLQVTVAGRVVEITVSKAANTAGVVCPEYWWEVDRLIEDERGQPHRERRWGLGLRSYETAEAAYQAAVQWVQVQPEVSSTSSEDAVQ